MNILLHLPELFLPVIHVLADQSPLILYLLHLVPVPPLLIEQPIDNFLKYPLIFPQFLQLRIQDNLLFLQQSTMFI